MDGERFEAYGQVYEELEGLPSSPADEFKLQLVRERANPSRYKMSKKTSIYECSDRSQDQSLHEVKMLKELKNPHIIKYYDVFLEENDFIVILEFCEEGDLDSYIRKRKERKELLSEKLILSWVMQILMGLEYIHSRNIIHRLISSHNIYMNHQGDIKIGSFGEARMLSNTLEKAITIVGSPCDLSPEVVEGKPYDSKLDIWALGCLIFELTTFEHPYKIKNLPQLYEMIVKLPTPDLPAKYSKYLNPIFRKMMKKNPKLRPSATDLLQEDVFVRLMREYIKKKKIDSLDLREITPRQLLIHKKKTQKSILPPLNPSRPPSNPIPSHRSPAKKLKAGEQPLSRSREKLDKIKPDSQEDKCRQARNSPPPSVKKQAVKVESEGRGKAKEEGKGEKALSSVEQPCTPSASVGLVRITEPDYEEGEYISLLYQVKLQILLTKYEPNMSKIFEEPIEFD